MPEFVLDHGTREASALFSSLDEFTRGFIEAMYFTETGNSEDGDLHRASFAELSAEALEIIKRDCACFQSDNAKDIDEATDNGRINGYDITNVGRDFWYSRNGHGCGFFDRELGDCGTRLHEAAKRWGTLDVYRGDDRLIYFG